MSNRALPWFLLPALIFAASAQGRDFAPITAEVRSLTEIPQLPGTPAVVLFKKAELRFMDYPREVSSSLEVAVRLKILTSEGTRYGEAEIHHSGHYRLKSVKGRTVLPDGRVLPLSEESIFEERRSRSLRHYVTKLVFPAVQVGAILDYRYTVRWDSLFYLEPWVFHEEIPTRLSEITYIKPKNLALKPWGVQRGAQQIQHETRRTARGTEIRVWLENLPGIPDEPLRFPFADLASRFMMIPSSVQLDSGMQPLMETWEWTCELLLDDYKEFRSKDRASRKRARELLPPGAQPADKASALLTFVRDQVQTRPALGVGLYEGDTADRVLADLRGSPVAKALLLQVMLKEASLDSDLVWVYDRTNGRADLRVPNPWWFDAALVRVNLGGRDVYLDPVDRSVGFGHLAPYYEGTQGVVVRGRKAEVVDLAVTAHADHLRRARLDLVVDGDGRVSGTGRMEHQGHRAWRHLRWKQDPDETVTAWQERLEEKHPGFDVTAVEVDEDIRGQTLTVSWKLRQRDEEVLGDEVSVNPTRPLGPAAQPFPLSVEYRKTPARMLYGRRDELTWTLSWPEGWSIDVLPRGLSHGGPVGSLAWKVGADRANRRVTVERRFDLSRPEFTGPEEYRAVRALYAHAASTDAQSLVLVRD